MTTEQKLNQIREIVIAKYGVSKKDASFITRRIMEELAKEIEANK